MKTIWLRFGYRPWARLLHRMNLHHATVIYADGEVQDWCQWCGLRTTRIDMARVTAELNRTQEGS